MTEVSVRLYGNPIGTLKQDSLGNMSFVYLPEWLDNPAAIPLSLSMPLRHEEFQSMECAPFFAGLLPDNNQVRAELARMIQTGASDDFGLLSAIGRDCAGAISIVPSDSPVIREVDRKEEWVTKTEAELAEMLNSLPNRPLYYDEDDGFYFSLAGVHDKVAVLLKDDAVVLPVRQTPSSHILKIDIATLPDSIRTEHYCLSLARKIGIDVPHTQIREAKGKAYMLIERYDRRMHQATDGTRQLKRVHQEDFCQARCLFPTRKYQLRGGPGFKELIETINDASARPAQDVIKLLEYAAFNLTIGNPDAHGKNFSLVYRAKRPVLAPLYDVNCAYAFRDHYKKQIPRLAMFIGQAKEMPQVNRASLAEMAKECDVREDLVIGTFSSVSSKMAAAADDLREEFRGTIADTPLLDDVVEHVTKQAGVYK